MSSPTRHSPDELRARARRLADEVLFPQALDADAAGGVPVAQLQALADAGFYGISTYCDAPLIAELIEAIAGGCLTTTFVWTQHLGAAAAAWHSAGPVRDELAAAMATGSLRGGVAFAHMLRPGPPMTTAEPVGDGWRFSGSAPWVTGWGHIDVLHAAARHGDDIVWGLIDAVEAPTLHSERIRFAVVDSTQTEVITFADHPVPAGRVTRVENYDEWRAKYQLGLRSNGSLALGIASRCCTLLGDETFDRELCEVRRGLDTAGVAEMPAARARASLFAVRAATALVASTGGTAVMLTQHAQRLMREAMFVLVQGQTPSIKAQILEQIAPRGAPSVAQAGLRP